MTQMAKDGASSTAWQRGPAAQIASKRHLAAGCGRLPSQEVISQIKSPESRQHNAFWHPIDCGEINDVRVYVSTAAC
jgi:hypothetical protein